MTPPNRRSEEAAGGEDVVLHRPLNVASVPQRSPFRYPGGKTWFVPVFRRWIAGLTVKPRLVVEPFAGGGIISLTALFEDVVERAVMVELDADVAAVWETIVNGDAEWLAHRILAFPMTRESVVEELRRPPATTRDKAFQTLLKNRTLYGGILAEGARFMASGENGNGIGSRWYPTTLARRLIDLHRIRHRIDFRCDDGLTVMTEVAHREDAIYFIDPPYTAGGTNAGRRLYTHHRIDHDRLFALCESLVGNVLITYNDADDVAERARRHGFQMRAILMTTAHHSLRRELIIGRDLSWLTDIPLPKTPNGDAM